MAYFYIKGHDFLSWQQVLVSHRQGGVVLCFWEHHLAMVVLFHLLELESLNTQVIFLQPRVLLNHF